MTPQENEPIQMTLPGMEPEPEELSEYACKCGCGFDSPDSKLVESVEEIRTRTGMTVVVLSGCRCEEHNKEVGGASNSQHLVGKAADIRIEGLTARKMEQVVISLPWLSYGRNDREDFVHIDVRPLVNKTRWCYGPRGEVVPYNEL